MNRINEGEQAFLSEKIGNAFGDIESRLKGNTLRVYWYMIKVARPVTIHEVQRSLKLSSPGLVAYHLNKLEELGLIGKDLQGQYCALDEVKVGVLRSFVRLYGFMVPRYVFYAVFFTVLLFIFLAFFMKPLLIQSWFAVVACLISAIVFWYEAVKVWLGKPF